MGQFSIYTLKTREKWIEALQYFPKADVYYLPEYVESFVKNGDGEAWCLFYEGDCGDSNGRDGCERFRGLNVVMVRPVPNPNNCEDLKQYIDFVTPYGYGGFLLSDVSVEEKLEECVCKLKEDYERFALEHNVVAEFVRFHPVLNNAHKVESLYQVIDLGHTVCLDTTSDEVIWQNITSKNRNMIRKAEKNGVTIHMGNTPELYEKFEEIYNATMDKVQADSYYYFNKAFYDSVRQDLNGHVQCFYAMKDDIIIAMSLILYSEGAMHYHLSASVREYQTYAPTNLLLYKAACWGSENGMKTFHLGGGLGSREDRLYHFKKEFNRKEDTQFSIGKKMFMPDVYERLCEEVNADPETGFFPRYRA